MAQQPAPPASRREQLLTEAARLFAIGGFHGVSLDDLGASVGISGPAIYRHFSSKDAVLAEVLVGISRQLLADARTTVAAGADAGQTLDALIDGHVAFALGRPELILVQDRDLAHLSVGSARTVRRLQRTYVELWVETLRAHDPDWSAGDARTAVHAVFGLLNSTPHSAAGPGTAELLSRMARAALVA